MFHDDVSGYDDTLEAKWLGGKQNDVIVSIGVSDDEIKSVYSFGFSQDARVYYSIMRIVKEMKTIKNSESALAEIISGEVEKDFVRKDMKTYEYLKDNIDPPTWLVILAALISIIGSGWLTNLAHKQDFFK